MGIFQELRRRNVIKVATAYTITAWVVIQVVSVFAPVFEFPDWISKFFSLFLILLFPVICIITWAFELTPEGIKPTHHVELDDSITHITGRKIDFSIITMLIIALGIVIYDAYFISSPNQREIQQSTAEQAQPVSANASVQKYITSIAVLPFVNMSNDPEQEFFSDGLAEELLNVLARVKHLKVAARTSSFHFKGKTPDIREIGKKLGVEHILEGSVRKSANKLRVTAQLIQAQSGFHLWSQTYDYEIDDIFEIQDDIATQVVEQMRITLLDEEVEKMTVFTSKNYQAQEAYMLGRFQQRSRSVEGLTAAEKSFITALKTDPSYQLAASGLADTYMLLSDHGSLSNDDYIDKATAVLTPFIYLESKSSELLASLGQIEASKRNVNKAKQLLEQAIAENPNYADAKLWLGNLYIDDLGNTEMAKKLHHQVLQLDPYSSSALSNLAAGALADGLYLQAEQFAQTLLSVQPNSSAAHAVLLRGAMMSNNWQQAHAIVRTQNVDSSRRWFGSQFAFWLSLGDIAQAELVQQQRAQLLGKDYFNRMDDVNLAFLKSLQQQLNFTAWRENYRQSINENGSQEDFLLLAFSEYLAGNYQQAIALYQQHAPELFVQQRLMFGPLIPSSTILAYCLYLSDEQEQLAIVNQNMQEWLSVFLQRIDAGDESVRYGFARFYPAFYLVIGDTDKALSELKILLVDKKYRIRLDVYRHTPIYQALHQYPEFIQWLETAEQDIAKIKATILPASVAQVSN